MIRLANMEDLPRLLEIYAAARAFMRANGNDNQWGDSYPGEEVLGEDIDREQLYVIEEGGSIGGCFMLAAGPDPTYLQIFDGQWGSQTPYGVIHRVAGDGSIRGVLARAVAFAQQYYTHLRIDTHERNTPMQKALQKQGFTYRGTIYIRDGSPRRAYDRF